MVLATRPEHARSDGEATLGPFHDPDDLVRTAFDPYGKV